MRLGRVIGTVTLSRSLAEMPGGRYVIADAFDDAALAGHATERQRGQSMPESLVVFDQLGAGRGQMIAISEGREAAMPFWPKRVPVDAYSAAIIDTISLSAGAAK